MRWADVVTFLGLTAAVLAFSAASVFKLQLAGALLLLAVICDLLDGRIARRAKRQDPAWGTAMDSLSDAVAFGMVPAAISLVLLPPTWWNVPPAVLVVLAGVYRLTRFQARPVKKGFLGMPITLNGLVVGLLLLLAPESTLMWLLPMWLALASILMVSRLRVPKL